MLEVKEITKQFENVMAVENLSLNIGAGDIYGLLGPNGAGKTTTIRMIMQIIQPDSGQITLDGKPLTLDQKDEIGYLPEERGLYQKMKVREVVEYFAALKNMTPGKAKENTEFYLERFDLLDRAEDKIEELSKGNQQKIQFTISIIHEPKLLILDEPFSGLDPVNQVLIKEIIGELQDRGTTILLSTHQMEQVEKLCERICLISRGKAVLNGNLREIKREYGTQTVRIRSDASLEHLREDSAFTYTEFENGELLGELRDDIAPHDYLKTLVEEIPIRKYEVVEPSLEQIFIDRVRGGAE
ncbi:MAG: ATP-binding cassette domain-containing protein [Candidatus Marinimicrobia bacterium]|nr:ATP-binding cassette domain-containing protein [Candidatus Neomarinimicrobiota bacterium]MCF7827644.1 ATP-binding cassette domain-containing protein [Candidatus Neomarinimicrobiota bacterium]MCF7881301.1 ATP-binding cassette domain-containing protein [Candidatus Neomarinimicrobiota bacterium]